MPDISHAQIYNIYSTVVTKTNQHVAPWCIIREVFLVLWTNMWNVITGFFYIENSGFQNKTLKYKTSIYLINNTVEKCQKMLKTLQKKRKILNQQIIFPHSHDKYHQSKRSVQWIRNESFGAPTITTRKDHSFHQATPSSTLIKYEDVWPWIFCWSSMPILTSK